MDTQISMEKCFRKVVWVFFFISFTSQNPSVLRYEDYSESSFGERTVEIPYRFPFRETVGPKILVNENIFVQYNSLQIVDQAHDKCRDKGAGLVVVVGVISAAENVKQRRAIRISWGRNPSRFNAELVFIVGSVRKRAIVRQLNIEKLKNQDLIQINIMDTYRNLTFKSISLLYWFNRYCSHAKFLLKVDDDVFIHMPNLLKYIATLNPADQLMYGQLQQAGRPTRNKKAKTYISEHDYPGDFFPLFLNGPAYLIPKVVAPKLIKKAFSNRFINLEDVFITGIIAEQCGIPRVSYLPFLSKYDDFIKKDIKRKRNIKGIALHGVNPGLQKILLKFMRIEAHFKSSNHGQAED